MGPQVQPKCFRHVKHMRNNWELRKRGYLIRFGHTEALLLKKKKDIKRPFFPPCRNWPIWVKYHFQYSMTSGDLVWFVLFAGHNLVMEEMGEATIDWGPPCMYEQNYPFPRKRKNKPHWYRFNKSIISTIIKTCMLSSQKDQRVTKKW